MDDYLIGSAKADEFDTNDSWEYSGRGEAEAVVYSSDTFGARPFDATFDDSADHVALVSYDDARRAVDAHKGDMARVVEAWGIPKVALGCLFTRPESRGFYTAANDGRLCIWYHVPTHRCTQGTFGYTRIHVWQVLHASSSRARILIACPSFLKGSLSSMLEHFASTPEPDFARIDWTRVHSLVIRAAVKTWEETHVYANGQCTMTVHEMIAAQDGALDTGPVRTCNTTLFNIMRHTEHLTELHDLAHGLMSHRGTEGSLGGDAAAYSRSGDMSNFVNTINHLAHSYKFLQETLHLFRHGLCTAIDVRSASYVRTNTIALRRIAQQNQFDFEQQKRQSASARKESRSMAKIASLTMLYLPASFMATFFSMPFFALDDSLRFSSLKKVWVYFIFATAVTLLTFAGSWLWDRISLRSSDGGENETDLPELGELGIHDTADIDAQLLEPAPYVGPSDTELVEQLIANMRRRPHRAVDDDED
ncbi:hypothetical protein LTR10_007391 [Elasticomyces elasticus]|nr:hypothetical protein LTR10_007391 [Elasticomyces elasticus]KAK4979202.1 hypothetical protein LTR42_001705 [Elasticomyces elasticus]